MTRPRDPVIARPHLHVANEIDWHYEQFVTGDELVRCIYDRHTDAPRPDPCAPWHAKETS